MFLHHSGSLALKQSCTPAVLHSSSLALWQSLTLTVLHSVLHITPVLSAHPYLSHPVILLCTALHTPFTIILSYSVAVLLSVAVSASLPEQQAQLLRYIWDGYVS